MSGQPLAAQGSQCPECPSLQAWLVERRLPGSLAALLSLFSAFLGVGSLLQDEWCPRWSCSPV